MQIRKDCNVWAKMNAMAGHDGRRIEELAVDIRVESIPQENIAAVVAIERWGNDGLVAHAAKQATQACLASVVQLMLVDAFGDELAVVGLGEALGADLGVAELGAVCEPVSSGGECKREGQDKGGTRFLDWGKRRLVACSQHS